jgi:hypothetical protein
LTAPRSADEWRALIGRKVSVRYTLHDDPEHPFSEAIGVLQSVTGARLRILRRRGEVVDVALDDVLAAKVFP